LLCKGAIIFAVPQGPFRIAKGSGAGGTPPAGRENGCREHLSKTLLTGSGLNVNGIASSHFLFSFARFVSFVSL